jgi:hypothetical protein
MYTRLLVLCPFGVCAEMPYRASFSSIGTGQLSSEDSEQLKDLMHFALISSMSISLLSLIYYLSQLLF